MLRAQIAMDIERGARQRRVDSDSRITLTVLSRFFNWRNAPVMVRAETRIRWVGLYRESGRSYPIPLCAPGRFLPRRG